MKFIKAFIILVSYGCNSVDESENVAHQPFAIVETTIEEIQNAILSGKTTCVQVVSDYIERIARFDTQRSVNAITFVNPKALDKARHIDDAIASGMELGELFCAPVLVKDNFDTHDMPTTGGSIALADNFPPDDAFMVRKIREQDGIIIAKTNMAEWAFSARRTESSSHGVTANVYALDRVPAGSSGGTASGVAANFGVAGLGSDTGNSIRGPSSHLALFGIRSTIGLTSRDGVIPLAFDRDIAGPMTRTVEDGARMFNIVAGYDPADPYTRLGKGKRESDYTEFLNLDGLEGARLGVVRALVDTNDADPEVTAVFEQALSDLHDAGAIIIDPAVIDNFETHLEAKNSCQRFRYDMYIYLQSLGDMAPIRDVLEVLETGLYSEYIEARLERYLDSPMDISPIQWEPPCPDYVEHSGRQAYLSDVILAMDREDIDALIYPTWSNPPAHLDKPIEEYKGDNSQRVAPATGMPAVTVPMGYTYTNLPAGLQILGRPYSEGRLIELAYAYEQKTKHRRPPDGF